MKFPAKECPQVTHEIQVDSNNNIRRLSGLFEGHLMLAQLLQRPTLASVNRSQKDFMAVWD